MHSLCLSPKFWVFVSKTFIHFCWIESYFSIKNASRLEHTGRLHAWGLTPCVSTTFHYHDARWSVNAIIHESANNVDIRTNNRCNIWQWCRWKIRRSMISFLSYWVCGKEWTNLVSKSRNRYCTVSTRTDNSQWGLRGSRSGKALLKQGENVISWRRRRDLDNTILRLGLSSLISNHQEASYLNLSSVFFYKVALSFHCCGSAHESACCGSALPSSCLGF